MMGLDTSFVFCSVERRMYSTVRHDVANKNWQDTEPATEAPEPPSKEQDVETAEKATEVPSSDCAARPYAMLWFLAF